VLAANALPLLLLSLRRFLPRVVFPRAGADVGRGGLGRLVNYGRTATARRRV